MRTSRSLSLTEAGGDFYESAVRLISDIEAAESRIGSGQASPSGVEHRGTPVRCERYRQAVGGQRQRRQTGLRDDLTIGLLKLGAGSLVGGSNPDVLACLKYIRSCFDRESGGFAPTPGGKPDVRTTAVGLMAVAEMKTATPEMVDGGIGFFSRTPWPAG